MHVLEGHRRHFSAHSLERLPELNWRGRGGAPQGSQRSGHEAAAASAGELPEALRSGQSKKAARGLRFEDDSAVLRRSPGQLNSTEPDLEVERNRGRHGWLLAQWTQAQV
jgi:hypothetical protein